MKIKNIILSNLILLGFSTSQNAHAQTRIKKNIDTDWKFHLGSANDPTKDFNYGIANLFAKTGKITKSAIDENFNDSDWTKIQLPHDWAVSLPITFNKNEDILAHGYRPVGGLYPDNSIGWYRKSFEVNAADSGKQFTLQFDGIFRDSKVWVNGIYLGGDFSGYLGQNYRITDFLHFDKPNEIVVRVDATQFEGWFYEGAGINRHVWLEETNNLAINLDKYFTYNKTENNLSKINVEIPIKNLNATTQAGQIITELKSRDGKILTSTSNDFKIEDNNETIVKQELSIQDAHLWDIDNPYLYRLHSYIVVNGNKIDETTTKIGIRNIEITADKGLLLNGKSVKVKGTNDHQEHAGVGSALPDALQYYRVTLLKQMGSNALRTSHAAVAPELLEACDSLGMLVLDEQRLLNSGLEYSQQFKKLIERDRNHPSVFLWSIGNEENAIQTNSTGKRIAQTLIADQKKWDPTRTSTYAADLANVFDGVNQVIPVRGFNYRVDAVIPYHNDHPSQPTIGTEMGSTVMTRGEYKMDTVHAYVLDQDSIHPWWASTAEHWWKTVADKQWMMGGFIWTGFDYRGEPTPFEWPNVNSHFGVMDLCGFPKNIYYYYKSWWSDEPVLHIGQKWNYAGQEGKPINVWVYSNAPVVELYLNNKSLGKKSMPKNGHLEWNVPYKPGTLKAVATINGKKIEDKIVTSGPAEDVSFTLSKKILNADGQDVIAINIEAKDKNGNVVLDAKDPLKFALEGDGTLVGFGNGNPSDHAPEVGINNQGSRNLFNGYAQVIIKSGKTKGNLKLNITLNNKTFVQEIEQK